MHRYPFVAFVLLLLMLVLFDNVIHEPIQQPSAHFILTIVDFYQADISDHLSKPGTCKFVPTCSDYMLLAVFKYGSIKGVAYGLWRIIRCSPFTNQHGFDYP